MTERSVGFARIHLNIIESGLNVLKNGYTWRWPDIEVSEDC